MQQLHVAGVWGAAVEDLRCDRHMSGQFGDRGIFEIGQTRAMLGVSEEQVP
jgi:hypothetical protein